MKLYHGTSSKYLPFILNDGGLLPRKATKRSNWDKTVKSNPHCVYLTDVYAGYFAACATEGDEPWLIIEVDTDKLDQTKFRPDEDFLSQVAHKGTGSDGEMLYTKTRRFRDTIDRWAYLWKQSVEGLGTCSYKGFIPVEAFNRVVQFSPDSNKLVSFAWIDPSISLLNHKFLSSKYKALTDWVMQDQIDIDQVVSNFTGTYRAFETEERVNRFKLEFGKRDGLKLVEVGQHQVK